MVSTDGFGRPTETFSQCHSDNSIPFLTTLAVVDLGTLAYSAYQAYRARSISTEFAESDSIFKAITLILLVCFMGIPILIIASQNADAYFFVFTAIIVTTCCAVLLLIFIPKIKNRNAKRMRSRRSTVVQESEISSNFESYAAGPSSYAEGPSSYAERSSLTVCEGIGIVNSPQQQEELREENKRLKKLLRQQRIAMQNNTAPDDNLVSNGAEKEMLNPEAEDVESAERRVSFSGVTSQDTSGNFDGIEGEDDDSSGGARDGGNDNSDGARDDNENGSGN